MPRLRLLPEVTVVENEDDASPVLEYLMRRGGPIAIDTETTGLRRMEDRVLFWSLATEKQRYFLPANLLGKFYPLLRRQDILWYLANAKYDKHMLANMGYPIAGQAWDIIDMDAMEDDTRPHGLKDQGSLAYGVEWGDFKDLFLDPFIVSEALGLDKRTFQEFKKLDVGDKLLFVYGQRPDIVENYASCDAFFTYMRAEDLAASLGATELESTVVPEMKTLLDYYLVLERPFTEVLWDMEREGITVDTDWVKKISGPMLDGIAAAKKKLFDIMGFRFNPQSNDELSDILYSSNHFGFKAVKYTSSRKAKEAKKSTDEKVLTTLQSRVSHESQAFKFIEALLHLKKLNKLYGTYVKGISKIMFRGRIHCKFNQSGTRSSRLSCSDPNLQNVPIHDDEFGIRGCFVADEGYDLIDYDYPQIEFRIAAAMAGEETMMESIRKGWDIHAANGAGMYKGDPRVTYEAIMAAKHKKETHDPSFGDLDKYLLGKRNGAKTSGLAALYGQGKHRMAAALKCSVDEAGQMIDAFFYAYPSIYGHIHEMRDFAHQHGFTYTLLGRRRMLHRINNPFNKGAVAQEERIAYNTPIQGSGAEMIKLAMLQIHHDKEFREMGGKLLLTVHDEIVGKAPKKYSKECSARCKALMSNPYNWGPIQFEFPVPVDPDGSTGHRWSELK